MAKKTIVNFILDKSGSMESVRKATIDGFNEYIQTLKRDEKSKYEFSLVLFDFETTRREAVPLAQVKELNMDSYKPDGGTALYDAVCQTISATKEKDGEKVITIIMSDGQENSSKEYNKQDMKTLIKYLEKKGNWTFVYLGANQDSYATAQDYGFYMKNTSNFNATARAVGSAMGTIATNTAFYSASADMSTMDFFSKEDQDNLEKTK